MINAFLAEYFISQCHQSAQSGVSFAWRLWSHLPATCEQNVLDGQETFHSLLFLLLLLFMPEPLMHAAACHTQGKTTWTEIK